MADPILGLRELVEGDPLGYLSQNDRNLAVARLLFPRLKVGADATGVGAPSGTVERGDMFYIATGTGDFASISQKLIIAQSDNAAVPAAFLQIPLASGVRIQDTSGGNHIFNGATWDSI